MSAIAPPRRVVIGAVVCALAGFFAGRLSHRSTPAPVPSPPSIPAAAAPTAVTASSSAAAPTSAPATALRDAWRLRHQEISGPARDRALSEILTELAITDPSAALALAGSERNRLLRDRLCLAALKGWAQRAPIAAAQWAQGADNGLRETALRAVFETAAATDPAAAANAAESLMADHAGDAVGIGGHLIAALAEAGNFPAAARFAAQADDPNRRSMWLRDAFSRWASYQPDAAAAAAASLTDPDASTAALHGVVGGWSDADPAAAVAYVTGLPDGLPTQSALLSQALLRWTKVDLKSASDWINAHEMGPAMDEAVSTVATQDYLKPDVAVSWAESVVNPKLRSETLTNLLRRWATVDVAAARRYAETSRDLSPDDRREVTALFATLGNPPL